MPAQDETQRPASETGTVPEQQPPAVASKEKPMKQRAPRLKEVKMRSAHLGMHGQGIVKTVKPGFGFIGFPESDEQLYFHASEYIRSLEDESPEVKPFAELVSPGDEVEFVVGQNTGTRMNLVAQKVKKLPPNTVKTFAVGQERFVGTVTAELNSGSWRAQEPSLGSITFSRQNGAQETTEEIIGFRKEGIARMRQAPRLGDSVQFQICLSSHGEIAYAVNIEAAKQATAGPAETILHGFIRDLSKSGGVIRCVEQDRRFSFRNADIAQTGPLDLVVGRPVMFVISADHKGHERVTSISILPEGSIDAQSSLGTAVGYVVRSLSACQAGQTGLIFAPKYPSHRIQFTEESLSSNGGERESFEIEDEVTFHLIDDFKVDAKLASDMSLLVKAKAKRELGTVRTLKSNFGFLACCQRSGQLFFHATSLVNADFSDLKKGDDLEFSVEGHPERGTMAVRVKKMPSGSAIFETITETTFRGLIISQPAPLTPKHSSSGILEFEEDGEPAKLLFSANDFQEEVRVGDYVTFQIADNLKAVKQVESLGSKVSRMIGRHPTGGRLLRLEATIKQILQGYGFLQFTDPIDRTERRLFWHCTEVTDQKELNIGDTVSFVLTKGPKMKEPYARKLVKLAAAPAQETSRVVNKLSATPQPAVRTPAMPDGTRGFHMGRGGVLPRPAAAPSPMPPGMEGTATSVASRASKGNHPHADTEVHVMSAHLPSPQDSRKFKKKKKKQADSTSSLANERSSSQSLNPHAAVFRPSGLV